MWLKPAAAIMSAGLLLLSGCAKSDPPMSPRELLGESDSFAEVALPDELGSSVQDLSHVFGAKQVFTSEQWGTGGHIVIAACTDTADVHKATMAQFGVVAVGALSEAQLEKARAGKYRDYIGCTKGSFR